MVPHKFLHVDWNNGFATHDAILDTLPYLPETLIVGTFNPSIEGNVADIFYGRNYLWPALVNLFTHRQIVHLSRRDQHAPLWPTLADIFTMCASLKLTFADLLSAVLHNDQPDYDLLLSPNKVYYNSKEINLIKDEGLQYLHKHDQAMWNSNAIIDYLIVTPSIRTVYLTRQPKGIWKIPWQSIVYAAELHDRTFINLYTPSGQGLAGKPRMRALLHHWVHNQSEGFGHLQRAWLDAHDIDPAVF